VSQQQKDLNQWFACSDCDLLLKRKMLVEGESASCPRCKSTLETRKKDSANRTLAVAVAGLISFIPAMTLPLLGLEVVGLKNQSSLLECIQSIYNSELYLVALLVSLFCIIVPLVRLLIVCYLMVLVKSNRPSHIGIRLFRYFHEWEEWGMLEVFMLGMVVALYKILGLASAIYGIGLISFASLLISATLVTQFLDEQYVWEKLSGKH
jgi:paraquat-inducible protein A